MSSIDHRKGKDEGGVPGSAPERKFVSRKHLHKTIDSFNTMYSNDSITTINMTDLQSTSVQFFSFGLLTNSIYKWLTYIFFLCVLLFSCLAIGPLMWVQPSLIVGCGWCGIVKVELLLSFTLVVSALFHYTVRRDLFPPLIALGYMHHAMTHDQPFLEPFVITFGNLFLIILVFLFVFFPKASKHNGHHNRSTSEGHPLFGKRSLDNTRFASSPVGSPGLTPSGSSSSLNDTQTAAALMAKAKHHAQEFAKDGRLGDLCHNLIYLLSIVFCLFATIFTVSTLTIGRHKLVKAHDVSLSYYLWLSFLDIIFVSPNTLFHINESMVRLVAVLFLTVLTLLYHLQIRKPYTLMTLAALITQVSISLCMFEYSMSGGATSDPTATATAKSHQINTPYGGGIFYILNIIAYLSFFCGLAIDVVLASGEKYNRWKAEGEKLHRRLSIELNQQSDFVKRVCQDGTQQLMERFDFTQKFVDRILLSTNEVQNVCRELSSLEHTNKWVGQYAQSIQHNINKTLNILDDIKLVLAIESGDIMMREDLTFNLYILLEEVFEVISKDLKNIDIELVYRINDDVPPNLIGDPSPVLQMIIQLLSNAIRYTECGDIGIVITRLPSPIDSPTALHDQDDVLLEISVFDNGIGMTAQQLIKCNEFQPFPTIVEDPPTNLQASVGGKKKDPGTGLGLFICNKIVKIMGGSFEAQHNIDGGMIFVAKILLQEDRTFFSDKDRTNNPFDMSPEQKKLMTDLPILLIDDNSHVRYMTETILRHFRADIHVASSTVEGIRELKLAITLLKPFKIVLVDYHMPGCDGLETIRMLKDNPMFNDIRIILLLSPPDLLLNDVIAKTKFTCITKPLTPTNLLRGISEAYQLPPDAIPILKRKQLNVKFPFMDSSRSAIRLLMGESSLESQAQIQSIIDPYNYIYTFVVDGSSVVGLAKKNYYDIILVNLDLAVLNGFEVADTIRKQEQKDKVDRESESRLSKRRESLTGTGPPSLHFISKKRESIPIIGISNVPLTSDILVKAKASGINECVYINQMAHFITNYLLDLGQKKKTTLFSPQKIFSPLLSFEKHLDGGNGESNIPALSLQSPTKDQQPTNNPNNGNGNQNNIQQQLQQQQQQQLQQQIQQLQQQQPRDQSNEQQEYSDLDGLKLLGTSSHTNVIGVSNGSATGMSVIKPPHTGRSQKRLQDLENVISRFVPIEFQQLIAPLGMENVYLGDAISKTITIFFSDIRDFTSTTEKMLVDDIIEFLNTYLAFAIPAITERGGFIDKFIGDAIMAIFPHSDVQEQAISAVKAAIGMMKSLDFMTETGFRFNYVETGIGINTGKTIIGIVGTETRMEPTALGDAVNLASRTEPLCKEYGSRILVTQFTIEAIGASIDEFTIRLVDSVRVKGKTEAVDIYEIIDGEREDIRVLKMSILEDFNTGINHFKSHKYDEALNYFKHCNEIFPDDKPTQMFIQRCVDINSDGSDQFHHSEENSF